MNTGILERSIHETPIAVVDVETTGLSSEYDRIIEISVVRIEPGLSPKLVLDTLVNPCRPVAATYIHGITDADVVDAPTFTDIAGEFIRAISGCVVSAYNVYFDVKFIVAELERAYAHMIPPHFCIMLMQMMLGIAPKCSLKECCDSLGIQMGASHASASDTVAAAEVLRVCLDAMRGSGIRTFKDWAMASTYKFTESFSYPTFCPAIAIGLPAKSLPKARPVELSRQKDLASGTTRGHTMSAYMDALKAVLADCVVTDDELLYLAKKRHELSLSEEQARKLYAEARKAYANGVPGGGTLAQLDTCLCRLGYTPNVDVNIAGRMGLEGKRIVVTGTLEHYTRSGAEEAIKQAGGRVTSSVSKATDFVVVGTAPGSKADKARLLGIEIIDEAEFTRRLESKD